MSEVIVLEEEHRLLKRKLNESLNKKQLIEATINKQFERLKSLEISLEKKRKSRGDNFQTVYYALVQE